jgi:hypothetical protein
MKYVTSVMKGDATMTACTLMDVIHASQRTVVVDVGIINKKTIKEAKAHFLLQEKWIKQTVFL